MEMEPKIVDSFAWLKYQTYFWRLLKVESVCRRPKWRNFGLEIFFKDDGLSKWRDV